MPEGATIIGRVAIKIVPDTEDFRPEAQRELDKIERQLRSIEVSFEADARKAEDEIRDALRRAQRAAQPVDIDLRINSTQRRLVDAQLRLLTRPRTASITPTLNEGAAAKVAASLAALSGARGLHSIATDAGEWVSNLDKAIPRIGTMATTVANLSSTLLAATSNSLALGSSLASTAGAGLALPGIVGGLAIGLGASVAVLKDFNDVLPEVGDNLSDLQDRMSEKFWAVEEADLGSRRHALPRAL